MAKVLVVDDDQQNRYLLQVLLSTNGHQVVLATNGAEALEMARQDPPDLIIADILMPVMDGFVLCREWKLDDQLKSIPFIFYTATYTDPEDKTFALSLGADRFIVKPVPPDQLIDIVGEVLSQPDSSPPASTHPAPDDVYLKKNNQALIHKLEQKVAQLEKANQTLSHEIKERKQAEKDVQRMERQLIQSQKMEAIGTLAGGIAHDFNNVLMAIMGLVDIALIYTREGKTPEKHLLEVIDACHRAKDLVTQILTFSRQKEIERSPVQIKTIVKEVLKMLRSSLPSTIAIKHNLKSDALILANPTQIYQVLMNLGTNASQAMKEGGGEIHIALSDVELSESFVHPHKGMDPGIYLKLEVRDNGVGIAPEQLERIFEPYYTTKESGKGTGLGLSVVHGIVRSYGGTVTVESELQIGSAFRLFFPVLDASVHTARPAVRRPAGGHENLLLIDDEPLLIKTGAEFLDKLGYRVTVFEDSRAALEAFRARPEGYALVITDMTMPGLTGDRLASALLQIRPDLPVILCTGLNSAITPEQACQIGIKAFMAKPFTMKELARNIRQILDDGSAK